MIICDLCGQTRECLQKDIDGKEYDICTECWQSLASKLQGKGRAKKKAEHVILPPLAKEPERQQPKPLIEPPKIWGSRPQ